jgi:hypothetical protein
MADEETVEKVEGEVGRMQINPTEYILFSLKEYKGRHYIDIRKYVVSDSFTGFTKQGVRFSSEQFDRFEALVGMLKEALAHIS